ncbi:MAG: hypothetical protein ABR559_02860, partial [Gemmatimonadota bacterium]
IIDPPVWPGSPLESLLAYHETLRIRMEAVEGDEREIYRRVMARVDLWIREQTHPDEKVDESGTW